MVPMLVSALARHMLRRPNVLPLLHPAHQLIPIVALVDRPKAGDTTKRLVLDLHREIRSAHQGLAEEVDAMTHVRR